jgi:cob(I)alamin adenosyltransferase
MSRKKAMHELAGSGDDGTTGLLGGGRAAKNDLRLEAYGTVDEASSALGLARALSTDERVREVIEGLQRGLYRLGAELATNPASRARFAQTTAEDVAELDGTMAGLEAEVAMPDGFILPGATAASAALDVARAVIRRAERLCVSLAATGGLENAEARRYLNRMSLLVFVLARYQEARGGEVALPARRPAGRG